MRWGKSGGAAALTLEAALAALQMTKGRGVAGPATGGSTGLRQGLCVGPAPHSSPQGPAQVTPLHRGFSWLAF